MERFFSWVSFLTFPAFLYMCYMAWFMEDVFATGFIILYALLSGLNQTLEAIRELIEDKE